MAAPDDDLDPAWDPFADAADEPAGRDSRTRRGALIGLGVVVVLVAVAITLVALIPTASPVADPHTAAQRWADAVVARDDGRRRGLECPGGSPSATTVGRLLTGVPDVSAGPARPSGPQRWHVPLSIGGSDGATAGSLDLTVVRQAGRYVVC